MWKPSTVLKGQQNKTHVTKKKTIVMTSEAVDAFNMLKEQLTKPPILGYADYTRPFELHVDAPVHGLGAVLYQEEQGQQRVIAYASRALKPSEVNYPAYKLEFLALKWAISKKYDDYLYGHTFLVMRDYNLLSSGKLDATSHRCIAERASYDFSIKYRSKQIMLVLTLSPKCTQGLYNEYTYMNL